MYSPMQDVWADWVVEPRWNLCDAPGGIAVDEFHHVSSNPDNKLGDHIRQFMGRDKTQIVAMTGSYFRGDAIAVLHPEDESRFDTVTSSKRDTVAATLKDPTQKNNRDHVDIIIALGMAKEASR